jgi:hypothetical protein
MVPSFSLFVVSDIRALLVTKDGRWPEMTADVASRIESSLARGGIKMWELFEVNNVDCDDNCKCGAPPLDIDIV